MSNCQHVTWIVVAVASLTGCADNLNPHTAPETPTTGNDRASVSGHVVDSSGAPVAGATVTVRASGEKATSDATGAFSLDVPANTTLTLAGAAPNMAPTLVQQFMVSSGASAVVDLPLITSDHFKTLVGQGANTTGGVIAVALRSMSGQGSIVGATVELTPNLGRVMYAPSGAGMVDPDAAMASVVPGSAPYAWAVGVQPHVSIMTVALRGVGQVAAPYSINDVLWPGTFTVDAGALTLVTLYTP